MIIEKIFDLYESCDFDFFPMENKKGVHLVLIYYGRAKERAIKEGELKQV